MGMTGLSPPGRRAGSKGTALDSAASDVSCGDGSASGPAPKRYSCASVPSTTVAAGSSARQGLSLQDLDCEEGAADGCPQIICVGVMRTGIKTLHRALRNLGYSNIYDQEDIASTFELWDQVLRGKATPAELGSIFAGSEVVMGMPTFCFWEQIIELYPNAQVILTVRNEDEWWESVRTAESLMHSDMPGAPLRYGSVMRRLEQFLMPSYHKFCEVLRFAWATTLGAQALEGEGLNEVVARGSYRKHNSYVKYTLSGQSTERGKPKLLVYDVHDGWEPLCEFLDKEVPEVEFPTVMQVPYFPGQQPAAKDTGRCFEDMMLPSSEFGICIRRELRAGLAVGLSALTLLAGPLFFVLFLRAAQLPTAALAICYLAILAVGWSVYVVLHDLVLRVPALVVLPLAMKSLMIVAALQGCFITYGILKEMLVTQDHIASPVLVLSSRFGAIVCASLFLLVTEHRISLGAPVHSMLAFAFTNEASTWAGYEMLKYVSFPIQVMAKSVKMLPSMLMGRVMTGTRYSMYQYCQALAALVCVVVMHFSDSDAHGEGAGKQRKCSSSEAMGPYYKIGMGVAMLSIFFVCDSFTSQWQNLLYKKHPQLSQTQMMLGGNLLGFLLTSGTLFATWGQVQESFNVAVQNPEIMGRIALLGVVYALGQFCIYSAIRVLGPLSFTWIMTARQLFSVLISLTFFGHGINVTKVVCIMVVFGIMSAKQLTKAMPAITTRARQLKEAITGSGESSPFIEGSRRMSRRMSFNFIFGDPSLPVEVFTKKGS